MAGVNKVTLIGNLGADPEVRALENGVKVARLRIATTESYKDKSGQRQEITEWHTVNLWRGLAEVAEKYLKKGSQVYIDGKIRSRTWQDQQGQDRTSFEIVGDNMVMLSRRDNEPQGGGQYQSQQQGAGMVKETSGNDPLADLGGEEDDLPF